jgi:hypothetical protein
MMPALDMLFWSAAQGLAHYSLSFIVITDTCLVGGIEHIILGTILFLHHGASGAITFVL